MSRFLRTMGRMPLLQDPVTSGIIGVGSSLVGGLVSGAAASSAADTQAAAANNAAQAQLQASKDANATQRYFYDTSRSDNLPFLQNGLAASNALSSQLGLSNAMTRDQATQQVNSWEQQQLAADPDYWSKQSYDRGADINNRIDSVLAQSAAKPYDPNSSALTRQFTSADLAADPVYNSGLQFGLDEGVKGINRTAAANGSIDSGATLKELTQFGNDYGSTKANDSYNRFMNNQTQTFNKLSTAAGAGQTASNTIGSAGSTASTGIANSDLASGNAIASGYIGAGNASAAGTIGAANNFSSGLTGAYNSYNQSNLLSKLLGNSSSYSTGGLGGSSGSSGGTYFGLKGT